MEEWRLVWRNGVEPCLSDPGLAALAVALEQNDPRLIQGKTVVPDLMADNRQFAIEGGDAIVFCGWQGEGLKTIGEASDYFAEKCYEVDVALGESAGNRWFNNFWDETPREQAFRHLLSEVKLALQYRRESSTQEQDDGQMS